MPSIQKQIHNMKTSVKLVASLLKILQHAIMDSKRRADDLYQAIKAKRTEAIEVDSNPNASASRPQTNSVGHARRSRECYRLAIRQFSVRRGTTRESMEVCERRFRRGCASLSPPTFSTPYQPTSPTV